MGQERRARKVLTVDASNMATKKRMTKMCCGEVAWDVTMLRTPQSLREKIVINHHGMFVRLSDMKLTSSSLGTIPVACRA